MIEKYPAANPKFPHFAHGGDYNPDQWFETPEVWDEDVRLMKLSHCNTATTAIFSWVKLEPEEGKFDFSWLDTVMDKLAANGLKVILATPSGARPAWLSQKYPEVLRVNEYRLRNLHGVRHNHCFTSPVYREKVSIINRKLAERYKDHPALLMWHVSNEYGGECHCPLCEEAFREFLKRRYDNDLDKLNHEWWNGFWSHRFTDWSQIESPSPIGESISNSLTLDWKRFVTYQTIDFYKNEIAPLRELTPEIPITTNLMGLYPGLDYRKFAKELDVVSWDNYPAWRGEAAKDEELASDISFVHDLNRSLKNGKPFYMMESTPSVVNWHPVNKLKRPGMHLLSSLQAVAHGADSVLYFQWRKSRGGAEKFHGAVVDHCGHENTRVFRDVTELGKSLEKLDPIIGTTVRPDVAVLYDWENRWSMEEAQALSREKVRYPETCQNHYRAFWNAGVPVDIIGEDDDFTPYKLLIAPMLYMVRPGVAERIEAFVKKGGTFVTTYWSGIVGENDLCYLGGFPGPLRRVTGVWSEEIDALYDTDANTAVCKPGNALSLSGEYAVKDFCDLIHPETAEVLATYGSDFYEGMPVLTSNSYGAGTAYYIAARTDNAFLDDFYHTLTAKLGLRKALDTRLPEGVTAQLRSDGEKDYVFLMNFSAEEKKVALGGVKAVDLLTGEHREGEAVLGRYGVQVLAVEK